MLYFCLIFCLEGKRLVLSSSGYVEPKELKKMAREKYFGINLKYLPIKAHYFFLYGGTGGTIPYMQVIAKQFGITSMAVGIIFTLVPLCVWISKPGFGFITDKFRDIRRILVILLVVTASTFFAVLYIPPIRNKIIESTNVTIACTERRDEFVIYLSKYNSFCDKDAIKRDYDCELTAHNCLKNVTLNGDLNVTHSLANNNTDTTTFSFKLRTNISIQNCNCLEQNSSTLVCETDFYACNSFSAKITSQYNLYNFWIFLLLTVISGVGSGTMWSLTDTACNEVLGDNTKDYGKQRLWGTISWGITTLASGFFNDIASRGLKYVDFSPGFYLMLSLFAIDVLILCAYPIRKTHVSENICKDVDKIFCTWKTVIFALGVYMSGAFAGLLWTYEFWFLTDLGSSQLLLGLVAGVQCLVAEVPFFFFSGWFVKKIGHFYCLIAALTAFALRMGLYSILYNPWWVLPIDLSHGVTFAVFFAAMTLYAVDYAPPGTEATMIGIFGGIFEGLGVATGSFLGGLGFDAKGGRWTFFVASMISLISVPVLTILNVFLSKSEGKVNLDKDRTIPMKETATCISQNSNK